MKRYIGYLFLFLAFLNGNAQQKSQKDVKVGLVLSGGGAKGLAHIGALKAIEEAGVHIDYIAGTSMGAIVGALYASGYTASELETLFKSVDFEVLIRDEFKRKNKSFFEREDDDRHAVTLPFNKFKLTFPSALSKGQNVYNFYVKLLNHVKDIDDFSKLPTPFFCIATNVENGKQEILNSGYLPNAITASSAIPSLFEPVYLGDKLMVDGGISNNYPIDELLDKDVDFVIGVDVQDSLQKKENLKSMMDIMSQISNFTTQNQMTEKVKKTTVYIKPDITKYSIISFDKATEIFKEGYRAATKEIDDLKAIAAKQKPLSRSKVEIDKTPIKTFHISKIQVFGNQNYTEAYVLGKLKLKENTTVTYQKIEKGVTALAATNNFHKIDYKLIDGGTLVLSIKEIDHKTNLKLGLHYDNLYRGNALVNITHKQLITNNDIVSFDLIIGKKIRYNFEYYLDKGFYWSVGVKSSLNAFDKVVGLSIFDNSSTVTESINLEALEMTNQFYIETLFKKQFSLKLGAEHQKIKFEYKLPNTRIILEDNNFFNLFANLKYDTLNDFYNPTKGLYFDASVNSYLFSSDFKEEFEQFTITHLKMGGTTAFFKNVFGSVFVESGIRIGNNTSPIFDFVLGGYGNHFIANHKSFYGYDYLSVGGDGYVKATVDLSYQFKKNHFLIASANFANIDDGLYKDTDWFSLPAYQGYALGYNTQTFLGPIQLKSTWSPDVKKVHWFMSLGYWF